LAPCVVGSPFRCQQHTLNFTTRSWSQH
jgi:hypothetical protein